MRPHPPRSIACCAISPAGGVPLERVRIETECGVDRQLMRAAAFGSGVAIWNDQRQGAIASGDVRALLDLFVRENFAAMPASFGEDEGDKVKMTCVVRFADGDVARAVMQLEHGRQSAALQRLARAVLDRARNAAANVPPVASLDEGLQAIAGGRLAVETLRVTLRSGAAGQGSAAASGWVLRLDGRDLEIEPDARRTDCRPARGDRRARDRAFAVRRRVPRRCR